MLTAVYYSMSYIRGLGSFNSRSLNQDTPELGEVASYRSRKTLVAYCSSVECAGSVLISTKGVPVLWSGDGDYCETCGCVLYFGRLSKAKAKLHLEEAELRAKQKKRKKNGL